MMEGAVFLLTSFLLLLHDMSMPGYVKKQELPPNPFHTVMFSWHIQHELVKFPLKSMLRGECSIIILRALKNQILTVNYGLCSAILACSEDSDDGSYLGLGVPFQDFLPCSLIPFQFLESLLHPLCELNAVQQIFQYACSSRMSLYSHCWAVSLPTNGRE